MHTYQILWHVFLWDQVTSGPVWVNQIPVGINQYSIPAMIVVCSLELVTRAIVQSLGKACQHHGSHTRIPNKTGNNRCIMMHNLQIQKHYLKYFWSILSGKMSVLWYNIFLVTNTGLTVICPHVLIWLVTCQSRLKSWRTEIMAHVNYTNFIIIYQKKNTTKLFRIMTFFLVNTNFTCTWFQRCGHMCPVCSWKTAEPPLGSQVWHHLGKRWCTYSLMSSIEILL